jgi:hypothetical protein
MLGTNLDGTTQFEVVTVHNRDNLLGIPAGKKIVMEYNLASQPVGLSANKFRRETSKLIRSGNYVKMRDKWARVLKLMKDNIWEALMVSLNLMLS